MATTTTGFPDATSTGVSAGVVLKQSGSIVINTPGAVISGLDIKGTVTINAPGVTLIDCKITGGGSTVFIKDGISATVQNCTIDNLGSGGQGITGGGTFIANNISNAADGIGVGGSNTVIKDNYIHNMAGSPDSHFDGIQIDGGYNNLLISHNTVINEKTWTSAIMLDNYWAGADNVKIDNNLLIGGGYTTYINEMQGQGGPLTNIQYTNNHVGGGYWGDLDLRAQLGHNPTMSGNISDGLTIAKGLVTTGGNTGGSTAPPTQPTTPDIPKIDAFSNDSGVAGDHVTNDNTVTLTGKAVANSTIKVFDGTTQIGTATTNGSGAWSYTTAALNDGNHSLTAKATNASGATSAASSALALKIDTTAPTAPTMATSSAAALAAAKAANTVSLTGTAEANSTIKVFDGSTQIGTATANSTGAWTYTTSALTAGNHSLTSKAMDAAGNTGTASKALAVNIPSAPTTPTDPGTPSAPGAPKIASFSNDTGKVGDGITSDNTLALTGTAAANSTVKIFDGANQVGTATANSTGAWNYTTAALADGAHSLTAKVTDKAGVTGPASAAVDVKIDTHAPDAPKIASFSSDGKAVSGGVVDADHVTLTGTAEANSVVKVFDGTKQVGTATTNDKGAWTYGADNLADGKHSFTSTASDAAGNVSKASAALGVNVDTHDSHGADSAFSNVFQKWNDTVTFKGTADPYSQITIYDNGKGSVGTVKAASDGTWSLTTKSAVSDAVHNFTTKAMDSSGQSSVGAGSAILGTNGADTLKSTAGNDVLHGNGGRDTFVFAPNFGKDVINDFQEAGRSHDVVQMSKSVFDNFADVLSHASQTGHDVVINAGSGNTLTLKDTKLASLDKYDFHFA